MLQISNWIWQEILGHWWKMKTFLLTVLSHEIFTDKHLINKGIIYIYIYTCNKNIRSLIISYYKFCLFYDRFRLKIIIMYLLSQNTNHSSYV